MSEIILCEITTNDNSFANERRFPSNIRISELKAKLELITGASSQTMTLTLLAPNGETITKIDDDERQLNSYDHNDKMRIHVTDQNPITSQFDDLSQVPKFDLPQEEYEKRNDSVLAFKMKNKLGRFANSGDDAKDANQTTTDIKVGQRCEVCVKGAAKRRATVMFVGNTHFKPGLWVGVKYDEPLGKNDGSFDGTRYFECQPKYGGFIRPNDLVVGDFPEISMDFDED